MSMLSIAQYSNNNKLQQIDHFIPRLHCGLADKKRDFCGAIGISSIIAFSVVSVAIGIMGTLPRDDGCVYNEITLPTPVHMSDVPKSIVPSIEKSNLVGFFV